MEFGIGLIVLLTAIYILLVKGVLWKILVGVFAYIGMYTFLSPIEFLTDIRFQLGTSIFDMAMIIPAFIILMASFYTKG